LGIAQSRQDLLDGVQFQLDAEAPQCVHGGQAVRIGGGFHGAPCCCDMYPPQDCRAIAGWP
jgi:hypothetical protein